MATRNSRPRQQSPYVYKLINGTDYQFSHSTYTPKSRVYSLANRASSGKVALDPAKRGMELQEDGSIKYFVL